MTITSAVSRCLTKPSRLLAVVRRIQRPHQRLHRPGERPERQDRADDDHRDPGARLPFGDAIEALSDERQRLRRSDRPSRSTRLPTASSSATSPKTPTEISNIEGMARNA